MQYLFTERAHLMCPHMCFGVVMTVQHPYAVARIRDTVSRLSAAHPFLNVLLEYEEERNAYGYRVTERAQVELLLKNQEISGIDAPEIMDEYERLTQRDWSLLEEGMLKIVAWRMGENTCFLLVFHHLLADGRGALHLSEELADCYALDRKPAFAPEQLISSARDLPKDSRMPFISRFLVSRANKNWAKENRIVSYQEYHAFANDFLKQDTVRYFISRFDQEKLKEIQRRCHEVQVTVNDYLLAKMMLEDHTDKIVMACDLRDRFSFYYKGALGNYSTAFSVEVKAKKKPGCPGKNSTRTGAKENGPSLGTVPGAAMLCEPESGAPGYRADLLPGKLPQQSREIHRKHVFRFRRGERIQRHQLRENRKRKHDFGFLYSPGLSGYAENPGRSDGERCDDDLFG